MKLLIDFFPVLLLFLAYKVYDIYVATAAAIAASALQVGWFRFKYRRAETMHLVTLGLLVVFGGLTLLLHDRAFIMWKPSIVNWLFAAVFLGSHFIGERLLIERMMGHVVWVPSPIWRRLKSDVVRLLHPLRVGEPLCGRAILHRRVGIDRRLRPAVDLAACSEIFSQDLLELCLTARSREETWVDFKLFGMMGLTIAFVIAQAFYLARHMLGTTQPKEGVAKGDTRRGPGRGRHFQRPPAAENERIGKSPFSDSPVAKPRDGLLRHPPKETD